MFEQFFGDLALLSQNQRPWPVFLWRQPARLWPFPPVSAAAQPSVSGDCLRIVTGKTL